MQAAAGSGFAWAPYYEREGVSDPSPEQIADDLHYLWSQYRATGSSLFTVDGKDLAVFVYNADDSNRREGCRTVRRWDRARRILFRDHREGVYVDLKVFPGYRSCPRAGAINGWHQYGPARRRPGLRGRAGGWRVRDLARILEVGRPLRRSAVPRARPRPVAAKHREHACVGCGMAADHDVQRVGRGHGDRERVRMSRPGTCRRVLRLERRRECFPFPDRSPQRASLVS